MSGRAEAVHNARTQEQRWNAIREFYRQALPEILAQPAHIWGIDPYEVDWVRYFTPIEFGLWQDIRAAGAVLYPQFPIGPYFADFASPVGKCVIECDGVKYHQNPEKDAKRDAYMRSKGWTVYRITGKPCLEPDEEQNEEGDTVHIPTEAYQLIRRVSQSHGVARVRFREEEDDGD